MPVELSQPPARETNQKIMELIEGELQKTSGIDPSENEVEIEYSLDDIRTDLELHRILQPMILVKRLEGRKVESVSVTTITDVSRNLHGEFATLKIKLEPS